MGLLDDWWQQGGGRPAPGLLDVPELGHGARIRNAFGQSLLDAASLPLPAGNLRQAILDAVMNQLIASPTNEGEAEALRLLRLQAEAEARNARGDR